MSTTTPTCATHCGRPTRDTLMLCEPCRAKLEKALSEMPALLGHLETTLTRQSRMGDRGGRGQRPVAFEVRVTSGTFELRGSDVTFDLRASDVLSELTVVLFGWTRVLLEDSTLVGPACRDCEHGSCKAIQWNTPPDDTLRAMSRWLYWRLDMLCAHEAAADIYSEITTTASRGWRAVDKPAERIFVGVCNCGEWLYAKLGSPDVVCRGCKAKWDVKASRENLWSALDDVLMTVAEIVSWGTQLEYVAESDAKRLRNLLDQWVRRGRITRHAENQHGRGMYPFGETLTAAMAAMRERVA